MKLTAKQREAQALIAGPATHVMLEGGSRSGKTFMDCYAVATRATMAPHSRHAVLRYRFNHVVSSIVEDTWPKMMEECYPNCDYHIDRSLWRATFPNRSEVWFGGLDDKDRSDKILGTEYATILLTEASQITYHARNIALTRLAQRVTYPHPTTKQPTLMRLKMLHDLNPPSKAHWTYQLFMKGIDPDSRRPLSNKGDYAYLQMNPRDNVENLAPGYLATLEGMSGRMRKRFYEGEYSEVAEGALWTVEMIDVCRHTGDLPQMLRIVVAVDPSGSGDEDNEGNDEIGIVVCALGIDGNGWVLEDLTCKAGPAVWGKVVVDAYDRWEANGIVAEKNFGGEMVRYVIKAHRDALPVKLVTASRGKHVRAEPISALTEKEKIRFAGYFPKMEDELCAFTPQGYMGTNSPNRADSMVWGMSELFPGISAEKKVKKDRDEDPDKPTARQGWMR